jgi:hypothetical protein
MKPLRILYLAAFIMTLAGILYSCHKEESQQISPRQANMLMKSDPLPDCENTCLQEGGPFYQVTESFTAQWGELPAFPGYFRNNKYFTATAWNDVDYFYIKADIQGYQYSQSGGKEKTRSGPSNNNYPFTTVIITLNDVVYTYPMDDPSTPDVVETAITYTQAFPLEEGWSKCTPMTYSVRLEGDGHPVWLGTASNQSFITYNLYEYCECETTMTGEVLCNLDGETAYMVCTSGASGNHLATFIYTPAVDGYVVLQGNLTDVVSISLAGCDLLLESNSGAPANQLIFEGEVESCQEYFTYIVWSSTFFGGDMTGTWTAILYEDDSKQVILSEMILDPMGCGVTAAGYPAP